MRCRNSKWKPAPCLLNTDNTRPARSMRSRSRVPMISTVPCLSSFATAFSMRPIRSLSGGEIRYGRTINSDEHVYVAKTDYTVNDKHTLFFRLVSAHLFQPTNYDGVNLLTSSEADYRRRADSWALGDTYLLSSGTVSSFHA